MMLRSGLIAALLVGCGDNGEAEGEAEAEAEAEAESEGEGDKSQDACVGECPVPPPVCRDDKGREIDCAVVLFACLAVDCGWLPECSKTDAAVGNPGWCCLEAEATMERALDYCGKICTPIDGGVPAPDAGVLPDAGAYSWCAEAMICVDGAPVTVQSEPTFPCEACATLGEHVLTAGRECR